MVKSAKRKLFLVAGLVFAGVGASDLLYGEFRRGAVFLLAAALMAACFAVDVWLMWTNWRLRRSRERLETAKADMKRLLASQRDGRS